MDKKNVVLVILNRESLEEALEKLSNVSVIAVVADGDEKFFTVGKKKVPRIGFAALPDAAVKYKDFLWLVGGYLKRREDISRAKKFLMVFGVPEENIVNLEVVTLISETWLANLRHIEENGADFFATGNEYMRDGLNLKCIPRVHADKSKSRGGVNLADEFQDLRQSYLTARYVFAHTMPGTIKFVLIGLSPYSFRYDNEKDFANQKNLQYLFKLKASTADTYDNLISITPFDFMHLCRLKSPTVGEEPPESACDSLLKNLFGDAVKDMFETAAQSDLNFGNVTAKFDREFSNEAIPDWDDEEKFLNTSDVEKNVQILEDYIKLCLDNNAKPVVVVLPCSPVKRKIYSKNFLKTFYDAIHKIEESYDVSCVDLFDSLNHPNSFCDVNHLNNRGTLIFNSLLSLQLYKENLIPVKNFCDMNYAYFNQLSWIIPKDEYNTFMGRLFKASAQMIACKKKIKIAFVARTASEWCGDDLYNLFANNDRFEVTLFLCLRVSQSVDETAKSELLQGVEQFKAHGLNVVAVEDWRAEIPLQDVIIFLTPYFVSLSKEPVIKILTPKTLMTYVPYALDIVKYNDLYKEVIFTLGWKLFFYSSMSLEEYDENCRRGMPRGFYSGHPKTDNFFKADANFSFSWKIARANTKKIIWAPHWSMNDGVLNSTFHWNYQFMYDFAKAHPEVSWIVKPHPLLAFESVNEGLFPSTEAYEEYLQKWNDLPNAQVYDGAYYQGIFATSDGMILDSSSFLAEYQYVNKPVIYLTRDTQKFYKLGEKILNASYPVDGKDLEAIATMIQRVFIEGDDYKSDERREIFDNYLNYPKANGMLASEFVYKKIADELQGLQF